ncbi:glycosyltransferase family 4 protein [Leptolyngbya sp. FACHB-17]|uniref:glycosyltransferase family 4 protein n=1 Tax=unclassified Leptolyngbya TaxID=2650499 RepID=UPI001681040F|nr:glycosyltransferase family 4 protein [Leptolyngbya sp. FACHB-17]MBD2080054.1 glycosyltransferase family 4 protein [Leptolyngbya sp. FACHB-17]
MEIKSLLVTGESIFLERHQFLFNALSSHFSRLDFLPRQSEWYEAKLPRTVLKGLLTLRTGSLSQANAVFQKNKTAFVLKSQQAERRIQHLSEPPDFVLQIFGTYSPVWNNTTPYAMLLDYTTALAERNWSAWATFLSDRSRQDWFECERLAYNRATHIFSMSHVVKRSLIQDYGMPADKITVVGSSGDFQEPYAGEKTFGSRQILFNGSDFERKGGEIVLAAFRQVRRVIPEAKLVVVGKKLPFEEAGIVNPGHIASRSDLHQLFLQSDLVVAPAYCDPFPTFLMEAMNYGTPCIVSDRDGMPEIVDHDINGIVIDQITPEQLAEVMINTLNGPQKLTVMSQAARRKMKTQLNWNTIADQIAHTIFATAEADRSDRASVRLREPA